MPGEHDLARMLASLDVQQRPGLFTFVTGDWPGLRQKAHASILEDEGQTLVVAIPDAVEVGAPVEFVAVWLTLTVWSSLESVGLTGASVVYAIVVLVRDFDYSGLVLFVWML